MTSIPSPIDAPRLILPTPGDALPGPGDALERLGGDDRHPRRHQGGHLQHGNSDDVRQDPLHAFLRGEGAPPLPPAEATRLADTLSHALRQDPSHPLFRELQQLPPDTLRQLGQFVAQHASSPREFAGLPAEPPAHSSARMPAETARVMSQALAQQAASDRPPAGGRDTLPGVAGRGDGHIGMTGLASAHEGRQPAAPMAQPVAVLSAMPAPQAPANPAPAPQVGQFPQLQELLAQQQSLQVRPPGETTPQGRAEGAVGAADTGSSSGLPGMAGAAGLTLAAVTQPAGTTHANAPQEALRARKPVGTRKAKRSRVDEAPQDEPGDDHPSREGRRQQDGSKARKGLPQAAPSTGDGSPAAHGRTAEAAGAAGHTTAAAPAPLRKKDAGREEQRTWSIAGADKEDDTPETRRSRRQQWLYWSLIAVTYGCLALALATVAPNLFRLPFAAESVATWRNALTAAGLATGLWAWLLARRLR